MSEPNTHPPTLRAPLGDAVQIAHSRIAAPGTWLSGATRVSIAAETRHATQCRLCRLRKDALSPSAVDGDQDSYGDSPGDSPGVLSPTMVDVVHRLVD